MNPTPPAPSSLPSVPQAAAGSDGFAIQCEVLRLSIRPIGPVLLVQYLLNCGVAALFAWQYSPVRALLWIALVTGVTLMRGFFPQRLPEPFTPGTLRAAQRTHTLRTAVWELAHGLAGVLLFNPERADLQLLLGLILMGMTLSSAFSVSFYTPATQLAITLLLAPVIVTGLWLGAPVMMAVAVIGIGLTAMMWKLVAERSRQLEENIGLRLNERTLREQALAGLRASEHAQAERLRFFSAANHDLRQPVMAIGLQAEVLRQQLNSGADMAAVQHTVGSLARAQQALEGLTNQLLEIGRIEAAVDPLRPAAVALAPLLHELARQAGDARVGVRCPGGRWPGPTPCRCAGCWPTWSTTPSSSRRAAACCWRCARGGATAASPGASRCATTASASRRMRRRACSTTSSRSATWSATCSAATGWGWRSCGGWRRTWALRCGCARRRGAGSVFSFELPAAAPDAVRAAVPRRAQKARERTMRAARQALRPGMAVLVVEDNTVVADSLSALLRQWSVEPRVYASAAEALALADLRALDAALCDIRLPGALDGIALAERLQRQKPSLAIALISADINEATQRLAAERGWHALRKPVQPEELRGVLLKAQQGRLSERAAFARITARMWARADVPWPALLGTGHGPCRARLPSYAPRTGRRSCPDVRRHPPFFPRRHRAARPALRPVRDGAALAARGADRRLASASGST
jgi:CheY-like chemotaxis protein/signal transduction histidine kinase